MATPLTISDIGSALNQSPHDSKLHAKLSKALHRNDHQSAAAKHRIIALMLRLQAPIAELMTTFPQFKGALSPHIALDEKCLEQWEKKSDVGIDTRTFTTPSTGECTVGSHNGEFLNYVERWDDPRFTLILDDDTLDVTHGSDRQSWSLLHEKSDFRMKEPLLEVACHNLLVVKAGLRKVLTRLIRKGKK